MKYVIDASVGFKTVVTEIDSLRAIRLRDAFLAGQIEWIAPDIFPSGMTKAERQKRTTSAEAAIALADTLRMLPDLHPSVPLLPRAFDIASQAGIGFYDCLYPALAEREGCELITADDKLLRNLRLRYPFMIALSTLP